MELSKNISNIMVDTEFKVDNLESAVAEMAFLKIEKNLLETSNRINDMYEKNPLPDEFELQKAINSMFGTREPLE